MQGCPHASQAAGGRVYRPRNPHAQLGTTLNIFSMIGGVITSTLLTLVVVPVIYTYLDALDRRLRPKTHGAPGLGREPADRA